MVFGEDLAKTCTGKPCTQQIECFENDRTSVRIYDSRGYEVKEDGDREFIRDVTDMIKNPAQHEVNLIWYCISSAGERVTSYDEEMIKKLQNTGCPLAVVLTKSDEISEEDAAELRKSVKSVTRAPIFETSIVCEEFNQVKELVEWSCENLPVQLQAAFIAQQKANFETKKKAVAVAIAQHVVSAVAVAASPIPFSDAPLLAANEAVLMARILSIYDLGGLGNAIKGIGFEGLLSLVGKSLAGSLLKCIPIIGTIIGGAINAAVATAITWAFGGAVAVACEQVWKAKLAGNAEEVKRLIENFGQTVQTISENNVKEGKTDEASIF